MQVDTWGYAGPETRIVQFIRRNLPKYLTYNAALRREPCSYCATTQVTRKGKYRRGRDHIVARSQGGPDGWWNRTAACHGCDTRKQTKMALLFLVENHNANQAAIRSHA